MGQEEQQQQQQLLSRIHQVVSEPDQELDQEPEKSGADTAGGDDTSQTTPCDFCGGFSAVVYCRADSSRLCLPCDRRVHGANSVSSRHTRSPLCAACHAAPATFRRAGRFLCSTCDFDMNPGGRQGKLLHDRCVVEGYTGCPSAQELAPVLGVGEYEKAPEEKGRWGWDWEEPQVFSLEDLIVPTTSCHGFQPLMMPSSPKNRNSSCAGRNEEIIRQLNEIAESEIVQHAAYEEAEQVSDQSHSWAPRYLEHGDLGIQTSHEAANTVVPLPPYEYGKWSPSDCRGPTDVSTTQFPVRSAETSLPSFVEMSEICPSMSHGSSVDNNNHGEPAVGAAVQGLPPKSRDYIPCTDRDTVISRYKEKRKTRRYEKLIRYESRKARADSRLRIKGRFAKANQVNKS